MFSKTRLTTKKVVLGVLFSMVLLPMMAFASTEFKGTETVNINKANAATLAAYLKGIGPNKADAIVKYRRANGSFKAIADLKNVPGIGDETFKDMKRNVSTSRGKSIAPKGYKLGQTSGKSSASKSTSKKKRSTVSKKSSTSKSTSSKTKSTARDKKTSTIKKKSTTAKKSTTKKKPSTRKTSAAKKSTAKKTTTKKKVIKKKPIKKKIIKKKPIKKKMTTKKKKSS